MASRHRDLSDPSSPASPGHEVEHAEIDAPAKLLRGLALELADAWISAIQRSPSVALLDRSAGEPGMLREALALGLSRAFATRLRQRFVNRWNDGEYKALDRATQREKIADALQEP